MDMFYGGTWGFYPTPRGKLCLPGICCQLTTAGHAAAGPGLCVCAQDGDDVGQAGVSKPFLHLATSCVGWQETWEKI